MSATRMFTLEFGAEKVPKSLSVLGGGNHTITTPIYGALVETSEGLVLLDSGISGRALADPAAMEQIYGAGMLPSGPDGDPLEVALAQLGFGVSDIILAAISHLHLDHTGGIPLLAAAGVPVAIQAEELEYGRDRARDGTEREVAFWADDYARDDINWLIVDGNEQLVPGVSTVSTPGHTPGHMSFRVDLPETGTWLFAADAADLGENLLECVPCGSTAEASDATRARESVERLIRRGDEWDARVVPGHDSVFWNAIRHPRGGHR